MEEESEQDIWIFGYGSLVWKADFPFEEKRTGYVKGFLRRFYQNSLDHRGTSEKPGRVVTLIHSDDPESKVWGMGYRIAGKDKMGVLQHLDHREKNGYDRHSVNFYPFPSRHSDQLEAIAEQILASAGQSGRNPEYVYKLADAMRQFYPGERDEHLFELEQLLLKRDPLSPNRNMEKVADGENNRTKLSKEGTLE